MKKLDLRVHEKVPPVYFCNKIRSETFYESGSSALVKIFSKLQRDQGQFKLKKLLLETKQQQQKKKNGKSLFSLGILTASKVTVFITAAPRLK